MRIYEFGTKTGDVLKWFRQHVHDETDECIIWPYGRDSDGYSLITIDQRKWRGNVLVCELRYGPRPGPEYDFAHYVCHNRACINYRHLSWQTHRENCEDRHFRRVPKYAGPDLFA